MSEYLRFIENTIILVLIWVGVWGIIEIFLEHHCKSTAFRLFAYFLLVFIGFIISYYRNFSK